jgi:hypothetical protein
MELGCPLFFSLSSKAPRAAMYEKQNTNAQDGQQINMEASGLKRVVVTGMGITSCLGNDLDTVADNLKNAK